MTPEPFNSVGVQGGDAQKSGGLHDGAYYRLFKGDVPVEIWEEGEGFVGPPQGLAETLCVKCVPCGGAYGAEGCRLRLPQNGREVCVSSPPYTRSEPTPVCAGNADHPRVGLGGWKEPGDLHQPVSASGERQVVELRRRELQFSQEPPSSKTQCVSWP